MPTFTLPIVQSDDTEQGITVRVRNTPIGGPVSLSKGFYQINMGVGCTGSWGLGFTPTGLIGNVIGQNSSQTIYVPVDNTPFQCLKLGSSANDGELTINPLRVWTMPGNDPRKYVLYAL